MNNTDLTNTVQPNPEVQVRDINISQSQPFTLIAGPCQMESSDHAKMMAVAIAEIAGRNGVPVIFKTSFDKANRTSVAGERGLGLDKALPVFADIGQSMAVLTDVHERYQCDLVAQVADVIQIPAFLSRQTDLLAAAAKTGRVINVKKGQFLAPWDMSEVVSKLANSGNNNVLLTERGTCFGYGMLVNDMRGLPVMAEIGTPVIFDATHSVQQRDHCGTVVNNTRRFVSTLARAAIAVGVAGVFVEVHDNPDKSLSDASNSLSLTMLDELLPVLVELDKIAKRHPVRL